MLFKLMPFQMKLTPAPSWKLRSTAFWMRPSPFLPWPMRSCIAARKGATPVPGPIMITGVSVSVGNFSPPFLTHRGTFSAPRKKQNAAVTMMEMAVIQLVILVCTDLSANKLHCPFYPLLLHLPFCGSREASHVEQRPRRGLLRRVL